jgi:hypothetical protein
MPATGAGANCGGGGSAAGQLGFSQLLESLDPGEQASTPLLQAVGRRYAGGPGR